MPEPVTTKDQLIQNIKDGKPVIANVIFSQPFVFDPKDNKDIMIANCRGVSTEPNNLEWLDEPLERAELNPRLWQRYILDQAITAKLESIEQEARVDEMKKLKQFAGDRGIELFDMDYAEQALVETKAQIHDYADERISQITKGKG